MSFKRVQVHLDRMRVLETRADACAELLKAARRQAIRLSSSHAEDVAQEAVTEALSRIRDNPAISYKSTSFSNRIRTLIKQQRRATRYHVHDVHDVDALEDLKEADTESDTVDRRRPLWAVNLVGAFVKRFIQDSKGKTLRKSRRVTWSIWMAQRGGLEDDPPWGWRTLHDLVEEGVPYALKPKSSSTEALRKRRSRFRDHLLAYAQARHLAQAITAEHVRCLETVMLPWFANQPLPHLEGSFHDCR